MPDQTYQLISADSHVNEPPDLWTSRVPAKLRDRAPRIERFEQGDAWVLEGVADPINFGMNACAGMAPEEMSGWVYFEDIRRGGYDPAARMQEMDRDGVDAEVLYPTPRLAQAIVASPDPEYHLAMVRAYNDWLSEYTAHAPERFAGVMLVPNRGAEPAAEEIRRVAGRPEMRGAMIGCYPNGSLEIQAEDDKIWGLLSEMGIPLSIHVSLSQAMPARHTHKLPGYGRFFDAPERMIQFVFAGVFDRFPGLHVVFAETDCGWVPFVSEQIDNNYHRLNPISGFNLAHPPGHYMERHFSFGFMTDNFGIANRSWIGVRQMLWSSDYPHISADWPLSWRSIQSAFTGVPHDERHRILCGNAHDLYGF